MSNLDSLARQDLTVRRQRLADALSRAGNTEHLVRLLTEVDAALARIDDGTYGLCAACHDPIEPDRLRANPLLNVCLDHLDEFERKALEQDLTLASQVQTGFLPPRSLVHGGWEVAASYLPAGIVSGDYCDVIPGSDGALHVLLGDVSGKGVAAALLMSQLHAIFRALLPGSSSLQRVCGRASDLFAASAAGSHFATLVCCSASGNGALELVNAGHPPALVVRPRGVIEVESTGFPLGMFGRQEYSCTSLALEPGECVVLYSDGIIEAADAAGSLFGTDRLVQIARRVSAPSAAVLVDAIERGVEDFGGSASRPDDRTVAVLRRK